MEVEADKAYTVNFYLEGQTAPLFTLTNWIPGGGRVHTLVLSGIVGAVGAQAITVNSYIDATYDYFFLRASNAVPMKHIQISFDNQVVFPDLSFKQVADYVSFPALSYKVTMKSISTGAEVSRDFTFSANQMVTLMGVGLDNTNTTKASLDIVSFNDDNSPPSSQESARVRFVHALPDGPDLDIQIDGETEWFDNLAFKESTDYKEATSGLYTIDIYSVSNKNTPLLRLRQKLEGGKVYTFFIEGLVKKKNMNVVVCPDLTYQYITLSIAHAGSDAPNLDIYLDREDASKTVVENVGYKTVTDYKTLVFSNSLIKSTITPTLRITEAGNSDKTLFLITSGLEPNSVVTLAIFGLVNTNDVQQKLRYLIMIDDNSAPSAKDKAKIRFFHASPGAPSLDVRANDLDLFNNLPYGNVGDYIEIPAKTYDRFSMFPAGNLVDPILVLSDVEFTPGSIYTMFALGVMNSDKPFEAISKLHATYSYLTISVAHASPDTGALDVLVDNQKLFSSISFTTETTSISILSGLRWIDIVPTGSNTPLISRKMDLPADSPKTLMITGFSKKASPKLDLFMIDNSWSLPSSSTKAKVRFVHAIPDLGELNVFVNTTSLNSKLNYQQYTDYMEFDGGLLYDIAAFRAGTEDVRPVVASLVNLLGGSIYTFYAEGSYANKNLKIIAKVDYTPPPDFYLRFVHVSPDLNQVDVLINDQAQFFGLDFTESTDYVPMAPGAYSVKIVPAGKLSPTWIEMADLAFGAGTYHTILIWGMVKDNSASGIDLKDDNTLPASDHLKLRFIHASPDTPAISVRLNGVEMFQNITYQEVSGYKFATTGNYKLQVYPTNSHPAHEIFQDTFYWMDKPGVYTVIAEGLLKDKTHPQFKVVSYQDAGETPEPPSPPDNGGKGKRGGLSKGGKVAIITVSVICGLGLFAGLGYFLYQKRHMAGYERIDR